MKVASAIDRLAAKLPASPVDPEDRDTRLEQRRADALCLMAATAIEDDPDPDRATVVVHVELSALLHGEGNALVDGSIPLHAAVTDRILCDCRYQPMLHDDSGLVIGIGFTSQLIPRWLRRAVEHRDHHRCTFPGCGSKAFVQVHHVVPWPKGPTDLDNLALVCFVHHKLVHYHGWHVTLAPDQATRWFRPDWAPYEPRAGPARPG